MRTIDEGIKILTGVNAGQRKEDGTFEKAMVNYSVDKRLGKLAETMREFAGMEVKRGGRRNERVSLGPLVL